MRLSKGTGCLVWGVGFVGLLALASAGLPALVSHASFDGAMTLAMWTAFAVCLVGWLWTTWDHGDGPRTTYHFATLPSPSITLDRKARRAEIVAGIGRHHAVPIDLITDITVERRVLGGVAYVWTAGKREFELEGVTKYDAVEACAAALRAMKAASAAPTVVPAAATTPAVPTTVGTPEERLARAKKMRDDGLITDSEYEGVRAKVLGEM